MTDRTTSQRDRRAFLKNALVLGGALAVTPAAAASLGGQLVLPDLEPLRNDKAMAIPATHVTMAAPARVRPALFRQALAALQQHGSRIPHHDRIAIADFSMPSAQQRFHLVDLGSGRTTSLLVAHGRGSDPAHTGYLQHFSNVDGSEASCQGAFLADDYYVGKHGKSQRLIGLDATNSNALSRAIVVHSAWYANPDMIASHGQLGRSEGCFAVGDAALQTVFASLGEGRMIYADKA